MPNMNLVISPLSVMLFWTNSFIFKWMTSVDTVLLLSITVAKTGHQFLFYSKFYYRQIYSLLNFSIIIFSTDERNNLCLDWPLLVGKKRYKFCTLSLREEPSWRRSWILLFDACLCAWWRYAVDVRHPKCVSKSFGTFAQPFLIKNIKIIYKKIQGTEN